MRKHGVMWAVIVVMLAVWGTSASALDKPQVFSLLDVSGNVQVPIGGFTFNRAPAGGDQFAIVDNLYKWAGTKKGAPAGRAEGLATFLTGFGDHFSHPAKVLFVVQAYLKGGSILIQGYGVIAAHGPSRFTLPVTGGTGIYDRARGYVAVRDLGNGQTNKSNVDVHLLP